MTVHAYERVASALREAILGGRLSPSDKLPSEPQLSTTHGVSRIVVRQALSVLRSEGLIESRQGMGSFVTDLEGAPVKLEHINLGLELRETVDDLTQVIDATRERVREGYGFPDGTTAVTACDANGRPLLADMLAAKANALAALAHLEKN